MSNIPSKLQDFFKQHNKIAIAFSGGVDSAYLLYAAKQCNVDVKAYYVSSQFQPTFELEHAKKLQQLLNAEMQIIKLDALANPVVKNNPANRCYYCKQGIFGALIKAAHNDGFTEVIDGTNASDDSGDRPGMKALAELLVLSPLRECGITKSEIRELSKQAGLFTADKPSYACLATRVATGEEITEEILVKIEKAENYIYDKKYYDSRIRISGNTAKVQITEDLFERFMAERKEIYKELNKYFDDIALDLKPRVPND